MGPWLLWGSALNTAEWEEMQIQGLQCGTIRGELGIVTGSMRLAVKLPALSPGSASHQPRDPGQGLTSLICRTELMMIKKKKKYVPQRFVVRSTQVVH